MDKELKIKRLLKILLILCIVFFCIFYLRFKVTYTSYESETSSDISSKIAEWNIYINDQNITATTSKAVDLGEITWENPNANSKKVAPSSKGKINLVIDPTTTSVAIKYEIRITDKTIDDTKLLTVKSVNDIKNSLIKTSLDTYTGVISLSEIKNNETKTVTIDLEWINDDNVNDLENTSTDYVDLEFTAYQYKGEPITAYTE